MPWGDQSDNVLPVRTGGQWTSTAGGEQIVAQGSWQTSLEKVALLDGSGALSAIIMPRLPSGMELSGGGNFYPQFSQIETRSAIFSGLGLPTGDMTELRHLTVQLSGMGNLEDNPLAPRDDGLTAAVIGALPAWFGATGTLSFVVTGGRPPVDGLDAEVMPRALLMTGFASEGALAANIYQIMQILGALIGSGQLSANMASLQGTLASFVGSGQMSAQAYALYNRITNLLGSGQLSAAAFEEYLASLGLVGGGALAALLMQIQNSAGGASGTGTMGALISQKYIINAGLFGDGQLGALMRFSTQAETTTVFNANGTFTIPWWCTHIDVVLLGGGGGGSSGNAVVGNGRGGLAAPWTNFTLVRGVDIPWSTTTLTVTRGNGGAGGGGGFTGEVPGAQGTSSTVTGTGVTTMTGVGGLGAPQAAVWNQGAGQGSGNQTYNTKSYTGGANTPDSATVGTTPGGGGGRGNSGFFGFPSGSGAAGGPGRVSIRAYQSF